MPREATSIRGLLAVLTLLLFVIPPLGQPVESGTGVDRVGGEELDLGYHITVDVKLVSLSVAVLDRRGRYRTDLEQKDFQLMVDDQPVSIRHFSRTEEEPLDLAVLLDVSGSMRFDGKLNRARWIVRRLVESLRPVDRAMLLVFADGGIELATPLARDRGRFLEALERVEAYGKTAIGDALAEAAEWVARSGRLTPALVLLTDGYDNASRQSLNESLARLRWRGVPVYPLAIVARHLGRVAHHPDAGSDLDLLRRIAMETGGRFFVVTGPASMLAASRTIETDLRSRYRIEFTPPGSESKPQRLKLSIRRKGYRLRYRRGYEP